MRTYVLAAGFCMLTAPVLAAGFTVTTPAFRPGATIPMAQVLNGFGVPAATARQPFHGLVHRPGRRAMR
jgi:hypothetical protein